MKRLVSIIIGMLLSWSSYAQFKVQNLSQFALFNEYEDSHTFLNLGSKGGMTLNVQRKKFSQIYTLKIHRFDQNIKKIWDLDYKIPKNYEFLKMYSDSIALHVLFKKDNKKDFIVTRFDLASAEISEFESALLTNHNVTFFGYLEDRYLLGGDLEDKPVIELHKLIDKSAKVFPQIFDEYRKIGAIEIWQSKVYFLVENTKKCLSNLLVFNEKGEFLYKKNLSPDDTNIHNAIFQFNSDNELILVSNFGKYCSDHSEGFLITKADSTSPIRKIEFIDFPNFYKHLPERQERNQVSRVQKRKAKGKSLDILSKVNFVGTNHTTGRSGFVAELYHGEYKAETISRTYAAMPYGLVMPHKPEFTTYKYSNALFVAFDSQFNVAYSYSFDMDDLAVENTQTYTDYILNDHKLTFAFANKESIEISTLNNPNEKPKLPMKIDFEKVGNKLYNHQELNVQYWYADKFIVYGYRNVRNSSFSSSQEYFIAEISPE
ncbi:MAG: hypothetical protein ACRCVT_16800 [Leadbetterella sp.]